MPEYARYFVDNMAEGRHYIASDLWHIARQQMALEDIYYKKATANRFLFCDTDLLVIKIWSVVAYHYVPEWLEQIWQERCRRYALFLLLDTDLPWQYDPQREHEHLRGHLFRCYRAELEALQLPFVVVSGTGNNRAETALRAIKDLG